jgi:protein subunit release factor A
MKIEIDAKDLRIDTYRKSIASEWCFIPTGTVSECNDEKSFQENKKKAIDLLLSKLLAEKESQDDYDSSVMVTHGDVDQICIYSETCICGRVIIEEKIDE